MVNQHQPQSHFSKQHRPVPEMSLSDFRKLAKSHFGIACEPTDHEYLVRFVGPPYKPDSEACRSLAVMTHNRGAMLSPHNINQVLAKFDITEERFWEAHDLAMNRVAPIRPTPPDLPKPIKEAS